MLARLHHRLGQPQRAAACLEGHLREHPLGADLTHVNILAELYMEAGRYAETVALIRRAQAELCPDGGLPGRPGGAWRNPTKTLPLARVTARVQVCHPLVRAALCAPRQPATCSEQCGRAGR